jgi:hypothetical protein
LAIRDYLMKQKEAVDLEAHTPQAMQVRASLCAEAADKVGDALIALRDLGEQDQPLAPLRLALRKEQERLERRAVSLNRRHDGMMAE